MDTLDSVMCKSGIIPVFEEISANTTLMFLRVIQSIKNTPLDKRPEFLEIYINSLGGDCHQAVAIVNLLKSCPIPVNTTILGDCQSAAVLIATYGLIRKAHANCLFMMHAPYMEEASTKTKSEAEAVSISLDLEEKRYLELLMNNITRPRNGRKRKKTQKKYKSLLKSTEAFLNAQEALNLGLIDQII